MPGARMSTTSSDSPAWRRRVGVGAGDQVAPVGVGRARGPDLLAVERQSSPSRTARVRSDGDVGAGVGLAHADAPHRRRRRGCRGGSAPAAPRCRTAAASGPSGGRRTTGRDRRAVGDQRLEHDEALERRATAAARPRPARSCRASPARPSSMARPGRGRRSSCPRGTPPGRRRPGHASASAASASSSSGQAKSTRPLASSPDAGARRSVTAALRPGYPGRRRVGPCVPSCWSYGGPEVLTITEVPDPVPGPEEVLVDVRGHRPQPGRPAPAAGLLPRARPRRTTRSPGMEFAGTGGRRSASGSPDWAVGDEVMGIVGGGAYAERIAVHERQLMPVPPTRWRWPTRPPSPRCASRPGTRWSSRAGSPPGGLGPGPRRRLGRRHGGHPAGQGHRRPVVDHVLGRQGGRVPGPRRRRRRRLRSRGLRRRGRRRRPAASGVDVVLDVVGGDYLARNVAGAPGRRDASSRSA